MKLAVEQRWTKKGAKGWCVIHPLGPINFADHKASKAMAEEAAAHIESGKMGVAPPFTIADIQRLGSIAAAAHQIGLDCRYRVTPSYCLTAPPEEN